MPKRYLVWAVVAVVLAVAALTPPYVDVVDAKVRVEVAHSIVDRGEFVVGEIESAAYLTPCGADGRRYSIYGIGQSLLLVPLDILAKFAAALAPVGDAAKPAVRDSLLAFSYVLVLAAVLSWLMFKTLRTVRLSRRSSAAGTAAMFLATSWLIWARSMQEETLAAALLLGALILIERVASGRAGPAAIVGAGLMLGALLNVRYNAVFSGAAVGLWGVYRLRPRWHDIAVLIASSLPGLLVAGAYNAARWGSWTETGYGRAMEVLYGATPAWDLSAARIGGLALGLDCGLLWFALPLLVLPWALKGRYRVLVVLLLAGLGANTIFMAGAPGLGLGGVSGYAGPRYLAHSAIVLAPLAWLGFRRIRAAAPPPAATVAIALLVVSTMFQIAAVPLSYHLEHIQDEFRQGDDRGRDLPWIPRRFANLTHLASGQLYENTLPSSPQRRAALTDNALHGAKSFTTLDLTPWKLQSSRTAGQNFSPAAITGITAGWAICAVIGALVWLRTTLVVTRRRR